MKPTGFAPSTAKAVKGCTGSIWGSVYFLWLFTTSGGMQLLESGEGHGEVYQYFYSATVPDSFILRHHALTCYNEVQNGDQFNSAYILSTEKEPDTEGIKKKRKGNETRRKKAHYGSVITFRDEPASRGVIRLTSSSSMMVIQLVVLELPRWYFPVEQNVQFVISPPHGFRDPEERPQEA